MARLFLPASMTVKQEPCTLTLAEITTNWTGLAAFAHAH